MDSEVVEMDVTKKAMILLGEGKIVELVPDLTNKPSTCC